jgi:predicted ATPase
VRPHSVRLVGRDREILAVRGLLSRDDISLVALSGRGGVGKTRLAIQVAGGLAGLFADGAVFVSLAAIGDPALLFAPIAKALDIRQTGAQPLLDLVTDYLREKHLLLLLIS